MTRHQPGPRADAGFSALHSVAILAGTAPHPLTGQHSTLATEDAPGRDWSLPQISPKDPQSWGTIFTTSLRSLALLTCPWKETSMLWDWPRSVLVVLYFYLVQQLGSRQLLEED